MELIYLDKACEATAFAVLVTNVAGFASALANAWSNGWHGNQVQSLPESKLEASHLAAHALEAAYSTCLQSQVAAAVLLPSVAMYCCGVLNTAVPNSMDLPAGRNAGSTDLLCV
jgi:hypothetical protein